MTWILHLLFWSRITSMSCCHSSQSCAMRRYWREGCQNPRGRLLWCLERGQVWIQLMSRATDLSQTSPSCRRSLNGSSSVSWWSTMIRTNLVPKYQSGFRKHHSTESVTLRVLSDIYSAIDNGRIALLALLDVRLSALHSSRSIMTS